MESYYTLVATGTLEGKYAVIGWTLLPKKQNILGDKSRDEIERRYFFQNITTLPK